MMSKNDFYRITDTNDRFFPAFESIYSQSFPVHEQRNREQQIAAFNDQRYHLIASIEQDELLSFIAYWDFDTYVYIEHLAVNSVMRGKNIGSVTLSRFAEYIQKTIILEIDPLIDEIANKRFRFYAKLGYKANEYPHRHPAYDLQFEPHELVVLSYTDLLNEEEYNRFNHDLSVIVMNETNKSGADMLE